MQQLGEAIRPTNDVTGRLKLYRAGDDDAVEGDARAFLDRTLPTEGLRNAVSQLYASLRGDDDRGAFVFEGEYGAGKTHHMLALYHFLDDPEFARTWLHGHGLSDEGPFTSAVCVPIAMQHRQPPHIWTPIFDALDADYDGEGYPAIEDLRTAVGDRTLAVFLDELEEWYASLDDDRQAETRGFLQALLEAAGEPGLDVLVFAGTLRSDSGIHDIVAREDAVRVDVESAVDRRRVIRHRLVERFEPEATARAAEAIADATPPLADLDGLEEEVERSFPFHPEAIDAVVEAHRGNQLTRGSLHALHTALEDAPADAPAVLPGHVDVPGREAVYGPLDRDLFECIREDADGVTGVERRVLNAIALHTLAGDGASEREVIRGVVEPGGPDTGDVREALADLRDRCPHLHLRNERYVFREEENARVRVLERADRISDAQARRLLGKHVEAWLGGPAHAYGFTGDEEIPDDKDVKVAVHAREWTDADVEAVRSRDGRGRQWRNTLLWVQPRQPVDVDRALSRVKRVEAADRLRDAGGLSEAFAEQVDRIHDHELERLERFLGDRYGEVVDPDGDHGLRGLPVEVAIDHPDKELDPHDARDIRRGRVADPFDVGRAVEEVVDGLLSTNRDAVTPRDLHEELLRRPKHPIPSGLDAVVDALDHVEGRVVAAHEGEFRRDVAAVADADTRLVDADDPDPDLLGGTPEFDEHAADPARMRELWREWRSDHDVPAGLGVSGAISFETDEAPGRPFGDDARVDASVEASLLPGTTVADVETALEELPGDASHVDARVEPRD